MCNETFYGFVEEPATSRPVLFDVDVAVAGSGLCGTFAAIASGRCGARTLVIERHGLLGGNIGPGMVINGGLYREAESTLPGGLSGLAKEFIERLEHLRVGPMDCYPEEASIASYLAYTMMKEAGVEVLLSAYAAGPMLEDQIVRGLYVEGCSGRFAVKAKVTIDGTGDAAIARRAGVPMVEYLEARPENDPYIRPHYNRPAHPTYYNDTQILCLVANADLPRYETFLRSEPTLSAEMEEWVQQTGAGGYPKALVPALRRAVSDGAFRLPGEILPGVRLSAVPRFVPCSPGLAYFRVTCSGAVHTADPIATSRVEAALREHAFQLIAFLQRHAPGFEKAYLVTCSPFLGWRGGPHIEGDVILTPQEAFGGLRRPDVLYRNIHEGNHGGDPTGFDVPYAIALPKGIDGLLVCGRGAAYLRRGHDPTGMRARPSMMVFGQAVGTAAAIAALDGVPPRQVDIRKVQRRLIADGIVLGDAARLHELGLGEP